MDELSERGGRELLRRILSRGRIAYDSLSEDERKAVEELVRLGYVKLYIEPNSKKLGDVLRVINSVNASHAAFSANYIKYLCLALVILMPLLPLYLSIRSLIMGYTSVTIFFLIITLVLAYVAYIIIHRRRCRLIKP
ncbi:hypothetical protein [Vulcanisaeta distributa]|uniref:hypothetical protein n=1 Tax=Vulcanisaeta distributa TaxID=164451 RepID=UPI0006D0794D|nr:hypothetical protein [Vulcanisaeta distributa]